MSSQSDHFTRSARLALSLSHEQALRLNNAEVGTAHLLLALTRLDKSIFMQVLRSLDVTAGQIIGTVERGIVRQQVPPSGPLTLAPDIQRAIQAAVAEARRAGSVRVGTGHLLLGMVEGEDEGIVVQALHGVGIDRERLRMRAASLNAEPGAEDE